MARPGCVSHLPPANLKQSTLRHVVRDAVQVCRQGACDALQLALIND